MSSTSESVAIGAGAASGRPPRHWLESLPIAVSAVLSAVFISRLGFPVNGERYFVLYDDAMISMRYARNLAEGRGLSWNPGQEPVEGYTNFLWTLWMALLHLPGVPDSKTSLLVSASGAVILVLNLLVVRAVARRLPGATPGVTGLALWLTALSYSLIYWTLAGLEVGLLALLTSVAILLAMRLRERHRRSDLLLLATTLGAALLVRTDGLVACAVIAGFVGVDVRPERRRAVILVLSLAIVGTLALHTGFRLLYYGDPVPNTFHLKVGGVGLATRLLRGTVALALIALTYLYAPCALAGSYLLRRRHQLSWSVRLLVTVFLGQCAYSVAVGGDAWEWLPHPNRYLTSGLPALFLVSSLGVNALAKADAPARSRAMLRLALGFTASCLLALGAGALLQADQLARAGGMLGFGTHARDPLWQALLFAAPVAVWLTLGALRTRAAQTQPIRTRAAVAALLGAMLLVATNAWAFLEWTGRTRPRPETSTIAALTRYALALRDATAPEASIAVVWAGAIPYFARRPAIDLLGKSDRVIAATPPRAASFWPGHDKWDYRHSIGRLKPDVIAQIWRVTPEDLAAIEGFGYVRLLPSLFVRADSRLVDLVALERAVCALRPDGRLFEDVGSSDPTGQAGVPPTLWDWETIWRQRCAPSG